MTLLEFFDEYFPEPTLHPCSMCGEEVLSSELHLRPEMALWVRNGLKGPRPDCDDDLYCPDCLEKLEKQK